MSLFSWLSPWSKSAEMSSLERGEGAQAPNSSTPATQSSPELSWSQTWYSKRDQWITDDDVVGTVLPTLQSLNNSLVCLSLGGNSIGSDGAVSLSVVLANCPLLERIDVSDNLIGSRGAIALSEIFSSCVRISEVVLSQNPFGDEGGTALATAFAQCSVPAIELLLVSRCDLSSSSAREFAAAICVQSKMISLDLSRNNIDSSGAVCICESLKAHISIQHVDLSHNVIGDAGIVAVSQCLSSFNFSIKCIGLENNGITTSGAVQFLSLLHLRKGLDYISLGQLDPCGPLQSVVNTEAWQRAGLPTPPDEVRNWIPGLAFIHEALVSGSQTVRRMRFMLIGNGLAGKTRLKGALLNTQANSHPDVPVEDRTIGIDCASLRLDAPGGAIDVEVWDFAGQEVSYLSHTQYFSARRCIYLLVWSPFHLPQLQFASAAPAMSFASVDTIAKPLVLWMEMLFLHVPDAQFVLCGTHATAAKQLSEADYTALAAAVEAQVRQKMKDLAALGQAELRELKKRQQDLLTKLQSMASSMPSNAAIDDVQDVASWNRLSKDNRISPAFRTIATDAAKHATLLHNVYARIGAIQDFSTVPPIHKELLLLNCACVDSSDGCCISELRDVLVQHCEGMPVLSESIPKAWVVAESLFAGMHATLGNVISRDDAVSFLKSAMSDLQQPSDSNFPGSSAVPLGWSYWEAIEFWGYLGRVFIYESSPGSAQQLWFVPDMMFLLDLIRPLIHWNPTQMLTTNPEFFVASALELHSDDRNDADALLSELKRESVLHRRLLEYFAKWNSLQAEQRGAMLDFFHQCHLICALDDSPTPLCVPFLSQANRYLVTARVCDMIPQQEVPVPAASDLNVYHAQFCLPLLHVSFITRLQSHVLARKASVKLCVQPYRDCLLVRRSSNHRSKFYCCIQCTSSALFSSTQRTFSAECVMHEEYKHVIYVHSDDLGLFQFATQVIEETLATLFSGLRYRSYMLAERDKVSGQGIWLQLGHLSVPTFSEMFKKNWFEEFRLGNSLHSLFPNKRCPIFISHSWSDGTEAFVRLLRHHLQEESLAAVCLDSAFFDQSACAVQNAFQSGLCEAGVVIVCLTPRYVTRPNCIKEFQWALDLSAKKQVSVIFLPLHPALTYDGIKSMLKHKLVYVSAKDDASCRLVPLSELATSLLNRYLLEHIGAKQWPQMKAWLSDGPSDEVDEAAVAFEVQQLVSRPVVRDFLTIECCADDNEALCKDLNEELKDIFSLTEIYKKDILHEHTSCFSPSFYPEESAARFFWSFSETLSAREAGAFSIFRWWDLSVAVHPLVSFNAQSIDDVFFKVQCESISADAELKLIPTDNSPHEDPKSRDKILLSAILLPIGARIVEVQVGDASKRERWLHVLQHLSMHEVTVAAVVPEFKPQEGSGLDSCVSACDLYVSTCRRSSVSAGRNMQLYLKAIMDCMVRVVASQGLFDKINFRFGNFMAESSAATAASAKVRMFLLTDDTISALIGNSVRCDCKECVQLFYHFHDNAGGRTGKVFRRLDESTYLVSMCTGHRAWLHSFVDISGCIVEGVSFAGGVVGECIPRESYLEGQALYENVQHLFESVQHLFAKYRQRSIELSTDTAEYNPVITATRTQSGNAWTFEVASSQHYPPPPNERVTFERQGDP